MNEQKFDAINQTRTTKGFRAYVADVFPILERSVRRHAISKGYEFNEQEWEDYRQDVYMYLLEYPAHVENNKRLNGILTFIINDISYTYSLENIPNNDIVNRILYKKLVYYVWAKIRNRLPKTIETTLYSDNSATGLLSDVENLEDMMRRRLEGLNVYLDLETVLTKSQFNTLRNMIEGYNVTATKTRQKIRERIQSQGYNRKDIESLYQYYVSLKIIEKNLPTTI